jgi:inner membrane protein
MPSIISHAAVPLAIALGLGKNRVRAPLLFAGIFAAILPDADVILFRFGATYQNIWSHRGFSHSLGFALFLGLAGAFFLRKAAPPALAFTFIAGSAASHGLLDMMTNGGHGIAFLWPLSDQRYFFAWRPIQVSPLDPRRFMSLAIAVAKSEILWIWVPAIILAFVLRASTRQMKAARGNGEVP